MMSTSNREICSTNRTFRSKTRCLSQIFRELLCWIGNLVSINQLVIAPCFDCTQRNDPNASTDTSRDMKSTKDTSPLYDSFTDSISDPKSRDKETDGSVLPKIQERTTCDSG